MSTERRFNEQETAYILERAAAAEPAASDDGMSPTSADQRPGVPQGMTLQQLQDIAAEVGLNTAAVSAAAQSIERGDLVPTQQRTYAGLPVGVTRTIELGRAVTDAEWERMVVALRETFQARGTMVTEGSLRHWSNGNLQALLEPTATGHRLRLQTRKGDTGLMIGIGVGTMLMGGVLGIALALSSTPLHTTHPWWLPTLFGAVGLALIARPVFTLPTWARTRAAQMEQFAETAARILKP
ncbi:MAG: hypothetical protein IPP90_22255 [Gemmatimonadaceae bacterium]|nr:hypothetical protein [Gemmatimonadaceae bacterium]